MGGWGGGKLFLTAENAQVTRTREKTTLEKTTLERMVLLILERLLDPQHLGDEAAAR